MLCNLQLRFVTSSTLEWSRTNGVHFRECSSSKELALLNSNVLRNHTNVVLGNAMESWIKFSDSNDNHLLAMETSAGEFYFLHAGKRRLYLASGTYPKQILPNDPRLFQFTQISESNYSSVVLHHVATNKFVGLPPRASLRRLALEPNISLATLWCVYIQ